MGTRSSDLSYIKQYYGFAYTARDSIYSQYNDALTDWNAGQDHDAIGHLCQCAYYTGVCVSWLIAKNMPYSGQYLVPHFLEYHTVETALATMDALINLMLTATFDQLQKFIGIEDAYRCALWDAPFNEDYYAALARGFRKW